MVISKKRHAALYKAISDPIMDLRVANNGGISIEEIDQNLLNLEREIYNRIKVVLDLHKGPQGNS